MKNTYDQWEKHTRLLHWKNDLTAGIRFYKECYYRHPRVRAPAAWTRQGYFKSDLYFKYLISFDRVKYRFAMIY